MWMLVMTRSGGIRSSSAQTGPPAWASTAFSPVARSRVDLPDMLEPVTRTKEPAGPISTSLRTHSRGGRRGWPRARAWSVRASGSSVGIVQSGWSAVIAARAASASASPTAPSHPLTRLPDRAFHRSSAASTCTSQCSTSATGMCRSGDLRASAMSRRRRSVAISSGAARGPAAERGLLPSGGPASARGPAPTRSRRAAA